MALLSVHLPRELHADNQTSDKLLLLRGHSRKRLCDSLCVEFLLNGVCRLGHIVRLLSACSRRISVCCNHIIVHQYRAVNALIQVVTCFKHICGY